MLAFLGQTLDLADILRVGVLAFLELLLSADNAIILAVVSSALPEHLRKKALYIGVLSAFVFRACGILSISFLLELIWMQLIGAAYLLYLSLRHLIRHATKSSLVPKPVSGFWKTVLIIELFDLAFAMDSIIAGIAFIGSPPPSAKIHPKLWIVYVGGMIGVLGIRYAAHLFTDLMHRFPSLEQSAYAIIGIVGIKLALSALHLEFPYFSLTFWCLLLILLLIPLIKGKKT